MTDYDHWYAVNFGGETIAWIPNASHALDYALRLSVANPGFTIEVFGRVNRNTHKRELVGEFFQRTDLLPKEEPRLTTPLSVFDHISTQRLADARNEIEVLTEWLAGSSHGEEYDFDDFDTACEVLTLLLDRRPDAS